MKTCFTGSRLELPGMPSGVVGHSDLWVESEPIIIPGRTSRCALRGRLDNVIAFDGSEAARDQLEFDRPRELTEGLLVTLTEPNAIERWLRESRFSRRGCR